RTDLARDPVRRARHGRLALLRVPQRRDVDRAVRCARRRAARCEGAAGARDFWSNGLHLTEIEASAHPADESWRNIEAMNDVVREILETPRQLTIAALEGNA